MPKCLCVSTCLIESEFKTIEGETWGVILVRITVRIFSAPNLTFQVLAQLLILNKVRSVVSPANIKMLPV